MGGQGRVETLCRGNGDVMDERRGGAPAWRVTLALVITLQLIGAAHQHGEQARLHGNIVRSPMCSKDTR